MGFSSLLTFCFFFLYTFTFFICPFLPSGPISAQFFGLLCSHSCTRPSCLAFYLLPIVISPHFFGPSIPDLLQCSVLRHLLFLIGAETGKRSVCSSLTSHPAGRPSLMWLNVYSVFISSRPNDNRASEKPSALLIRTAELLFWLTRVALFTLGAWERTPGSFWHPLRFQT